MNILIPICGPIKEPLLKEKMWCVSGFLVFKVGCVHARGLHDDPWGTEEKSNGTPITVFEMSSF